MKRIPTREEAFETIIAWECFKEFKEMGLDEVAYLVLGAFLEEHD